MQRPTSVLVLGILNLIFGALGLCTTAVGILGLVAVQNIERGDDHVPLALRLMQSNEMFRVFSYTSIGLGVIATLVLAVAGIGLLQVKPWGRHLSIFYGVYGIVMSIVAVVVNLMVYSPALEAAQQNANPRETTEAMGGLIGAGLGGCFGLIYPCVLLGFMLFQPTVREAFGVGRNQSEVMDIPDDNSYSDSMS